MPKPWELNFVGASGAEGETLSPWERGFTEEEKAEWAEQPPPPPPAEPESEAGFGENYGKGFISGIYNIGTFMYGAAEAAQRPRRQHRAQGVPLDAAEVRLCAREQFVDAGIIRTHQIDPHEFVEFHCASSGWHHSSSWEMVQWP